VHKQIVAERDKGTAVVIISAELDEIYALADRIAVMYEGRITGFRPPTVPVEELGLLMAGAAAAEDGAQPAAAGGPDSADVALETDPPATDEPAGTSNPPGGAHE
jgi:general nucleoside transport system ATP-binding protein